MMKRKFLSEDSRTGIPEGSVVELDEKELSEVPFNVKLKLLEPIDDEDKLEELAKKQAEEELLSVLSSSGLSRARRAKIVEKYSSLEELEKHAQKAGIDDLTDEFIKKEFGKKKISKKKGSEE